MADRSLVTRLRAVGGPSYELLVLLDQHRVLTSGQLARLSGAPARTVTYRLDRLLQAKLVAFARPGLETGSSPRFWWLTPYGARLVAGVAPAEGKRPSALFAAHASAIAEVWLAVLEQGPAAGLSGTGWVPDRAGWYTWRRGGVDVTLSPDAILSADLSVPSGTGGPAAGGPAAVAETVAFVEVDLATMSQSKLREKVDRYLGYAQAREWDGRWPHCPPLLLWTTSEARAATFVRAAARIAASDRRGRGLDYRFAGYGRAGREVAAAERLVIAACAHVRRPQAAIGDAVWLLAPDDPDDEPAVVTLAELLGERVAAQQVAADWYERIAADRDAAHRRARLTALAHPGSVVQRDRGNELAERLGDPIAAAAYQHLARDAAAFLAAEPELAEQVLAWDEGHGDGEQLRAVLRVRHEQLLAEQIRAVLAAPRSLAGHPQAAAAAAALQSGRLLSPWALTALAGEVTETREKLQARLLADYTARRDGELAEQRQALGRWARRRADPGAAAAAYDARHLRVCDCCAIATPVDDEHEWDWLPDEDKCRQCDAGHVTIAYADRGQVPTLEQRMAELRARLVAGGR